MNEEKVLTENEIDSLKTRNKELEGQVRVKGDTIMQMRQKEIRIEETLKEYLDKMQSGREAAMLAELEAVKAEAEAAKRAEAAAKAEVEALRANLSINNTAADLMGTIQAKAGTIATALAQGRPKKEIKNYEAFKQEYLTNGFSITRDMCKRYHANRQVLEMRLREENIYKEKRKGRPKKQK